MCAIMQKLRMCSCFISLYYICYLAVCIIWKCMHNYEMMRTFSLDSGGMPRRFVQSEPIRPLTAHVPLAHDLATFTDAVHKTASDTGVRLSGFFTGDATLITS